MIRFPRREAEESPQSYSISQNTSAHSLVVTEFTHVRGRLAYMSSGIIMSMSNLSLGVNYPLTSDLTSKKVLIFIKCSKTPEQN